MRVPAERSYQEGNEQQHLGQQQGFREKLGVSQEIPSVRFLDEDGKGGKPDGGALGVSLRSSGA